jgi:hypothetical protein
MSLANLIGTIVPAELKPLFFGQRGGGRERSYEIRIFKTESSATGLPDGNFSNLKSQFW